jgi:Holliday junction resolvasome RuvABC endonuclease subunit
MNESRILAVDPGRTVLGVAVFEGATLRYYGVKSLRVPGTPAEVRRAAAHLLANLIAAYRLTHMVIEQPLVVQQRAELLAHVIGALKTAARAHGLSVSEYAPLAVRRLVCAGAPPTKREVAHSLAARYPELSRYTSTPGKWAGAYYERMFGAVAVGLVASTLGGLQVEESGGRPEWGNFHIRPL